MVVGGGCTSGGGVAVGGVHGSRGGVHGGTHPSGMHCC